MACVAAAEAEAMVCVAAAEAVTMVVVAEVVTMAVVIAVVAITGEAAIAIGGGKRYSGKHHGHGRGHGNYRHGHGYGYWRGGVWIATGIIGYGAAGSYCSQLYYYDYYRWQYECQY